jgi:F0F1-type ATP synthase assembly protein I
MPLSYRVVTLQAFAALIVAACLLLLSAEEASGALLAGAVGVIPSGYLAWRAQVERSPGRLLGQGMVKFALTVVLMALAFVWFKPPPLGFFATLVLMQLMYIVGVLGTAGKQAA